MLSQRKLWAGGLLALAGLAGGHAATQVGDKFPPIGPSTLTGGALPATAGKITLIDFWASWCAPCKRSFPSYAQLHADYRSRDVVIVAVSVDEDRGAFEAFVKTQAPPFAALLDQDHRLVRLVEASAIPSCYLLGRDGRVRFVHQGYRGAETDKELRREIDSLLAEPPPPS